MAMDLPHFFHHTSCLRHSVPEPRVDAACRAVKRQFRTLNHLTGHELAVEGAVAAAEEEAEEEAPARQPAGALLVAMAFRFRLDAQPSPFHLRVRLQPLVFRLESTRPKQHRLH